jgi:hypothetical protein
LSVIDVPIIKYEIAPRLRFILIVFGMIYIRPEYILFPKIKYLANFYCQIKLRYRLNQSFFRLIYGRLSRIAMPIKRIKKFKNNYVALNIPNTSY